MKTSIFYTSFSSPVGVVNLFGTEKEIHHISFGRRALQQVYRKTNLDPDDPPVHNEGPLISIVALLQSFLLGKTEKIPAKANLSCLTPFQRRVLKTLEEIPYGEVRSYQWVAARIGNPKACRAVGAACGANPVPILIPCHRVVARDGSLGGFSSGIEIKKRLLRLENRPSSARLRSPRPFA
jgi:methylated-DNA-[protein]-cysteine S-methyltransferase